MVNSQKEGPPQYRPQYTVIPVIRPTPKQIGLNMIGPVGSYYWVGSEEADIYIYMYV